MTTPNLEQTLLPCPFCGKEPIMRSPNSFNYSIFCECGQSQSVGYRDESTAAQQWNTRHFTPDEQPKEYTQSWKRRLKEVEAFGLMNGALTGLLYQVDKTIHPKIVEILDRVKALEKEACELSALPTVQPQPDKTVDELAEKWHREITDLTDRARNAIKQAILEALKREPK